MEKVKWVKLLSLFTSLHLILHLLFLLKKSVEYDQPLLHLSIPCLFPFTLILRSLLFFINIFYNILQYPKGDINSGHTHWIITMGVTMTIDKGRCIAKADTVLHWIHKQIYFRIRRKKVRSTMLFCYISPCVLKPLLYKTNKYFPCMFHRPPMIWINRKMIDCLFNWTSSVVPSIFVRGC